MLAAFLFGDCVPPVYWLTDPKVASACGLRSGILYAILLTLLGVAIFLGHAWKASWMPGMVNAFNRDTLSTTGTHLSTFPIKMIVVAYVVTVWLVVPTVFRVSATQQWHGYQTAIQKLMDQYQISRLAAINIVAEWKSGSIDTGTTSLVKTPHRFLPGRRPTDRAPVLESEDAQLHSSLPTNPPDTPHQPTLPHPGASVLILPPPSAPDAIPNPNPDHMSDEDTSFFVQWRPPVVPAKSRSTTLLSLLGSSSASVPFRSSVSTDVPVSSSPSPSVVVMPTPDVVIQVPVDEPAGRSLVRELASVVRSSPQFNIPSVELLERATVEAGLTTVILRVSHGALHQGDHLMMRASDSLMGIVSKLCTTAETPMYAPSEGAVKLHCPGIPIGFVMPMGMRLKIASHEQQLVNLRELKDAVNH